MGSLSILVVDDSAIYRKILSAAVEATGIASTLQTASNGVIALERMEQGKYDVVLLDVNMPEMDGIETLRRIKMKFPQTHVIMLSSIGGKNAVITIKALELGALDFVVKPLEESYERNMEIIAGHLKLLFAQVNLNSISASMATTRSSPTNVENRKTSLSGVDLVLVAASTGGPLALEKVITGLSNRFAKPVLVVQHMPPDFTKALAETIHHKGNIRVIEGKEADIVRSGQAIIAPGGLHMVVSKQEYSSSRSIRLLATEYVNGVRPAADVLFKSVAKEYAGARILAVILTGMGSDGMAGVAELKKSCFCYCITQSEASCVVYGMPRSVSEAGLSDEVVHIDHISRRIEEISEKGS